MAIFRNITVRRDAIFNGPIENIYKSLYPVGSIYISTSPTNPGQIFKGTWVAFSEGKTILGYGTGTDVDGVSKTFNNGQQNPKGYYNIQTHTHTTPAMTSENSTTLGTASGTTGNNSANLTGGGNTGWTGGTSGGTENWSSGNGNEGHHNRSIFMSQSSNVSGGVAWFYNSDNRAAFCHDTNRRFSDSGSSTNGWYNLHINMSHNHYMPDHTHNVPSHNHYIGSHNHTVAAHTHANSEHTHTIGEHTHTVSANTGHPSISYQANGNNLQPYQSVYMWKRIS